MAIRQALSELHGRQDFPVDAYYQKGLKKKNKPEETRFSDQRQTIKVLSGPAWTAREGPEETPPSFLPAP